MPLAALRAPIAVLLTPSAVLPAPGAVLRTPCYSLLTDRRSDPVSEIGVCREVWALLSTRRLEAAPTAELGGFCEWISFRRPYGCHAAQSFSKDLTIWVSVLPAECLRRSLLLFVWRSSFDVL